jgi:hypothetical protein
MTSFEVSFLYVKDTPIVQCIPKIQYPENRNKYSEKRNCEASVPVSGVSVSELYIPKIGPHIFLQQNRHTDPWNI